MKVIGILGGMSYESSLEYYRLINVFTKELIGHNHSAELIMHSYDFDRIEQLQHEGKWDQLTSILVDTSIHLKEAGAQAIVIATNTMHKMANDIEEQAGIKVLHIAEATGQEIVNNKQNKVLLLGTKFTMEGDFYKNKLEEFGIEVMIPSEEDRESIHSIIYKELIYGDLLDSSREKYVSIIEKAQKEGAQGVVLGCTEIPLLIQDKDVDISVYDTMTLHCKRAVSWANEGDIYED
jgi:aspartate racemase